MKQLTVYVTAPRVVQQTDRYEEYFFKIGHHFKQAAILESRELFPTTKAWLAGWPGVLERLDVLVFIRNEEKYVGKGTFEEIMQAHNAGKEIYMCVTNKADELVLVEWDELKCKMNEYPNKVNFARFVTMERAKQAS
jgi:hypothetical protein